MDDEKILHVVAFNVPHPPDYGGIIDVYYKLHALHEQGVKIILHCFVYERPEAEALNTICSEVYYYKRKSGIRYFFSSLPYIVSSRVSNKLTERLNADKYPVLFEGLHSTMTLYKDALISGKKIVRTHNIEHKYYRMLAKSEGNVFRKVFLFTEARKLKRYESVLRKADMLIAISTTDNKYFRNTYGKSNFIPAFHQHTETNNKLGKGAYILFHGNLSVPENEQALLYLLNKVLSKINYSVIIAGKNPGKGIIRNCSKYSHIELIPNPVGEEMNRLVQDAHINLLYTYQPTGLKLKLLHSLYGGRHCLANPLMLSGSGLDELCSIYSTTAEAIKKIEQLMQVEFTSSQMNTRRETLKAYGSNKIAEKLTKLIFDH